uniref:DNA-directed RNA polymerase subunit beta n=1 Tax=Plagiogramma staurophorum TaxID=1003089 RepID=A0A2U9NME9_9STRA|nr:RNA polymerase beta subunit [Plagiogramma staurophorum]AWT38242.1 RNA polymerase beta subunit [Plagiogramma staurophorum]
MKQHMNFIMTLPDFIEMQRTSFCWFLTQGLSEELSLFSRIHDFSQNTEYILFGNEYSLIKPPCSLLIARKYSGNYRAQLVIPLEVRNKKVNIIHYHNQFPIITLPLMTTSATFIINGCERVIISQIIRSPGVYFEKNKNQKKRNQFKRKLSTDISKLRSFLPSGEACISEFDLFFSIPRKTTDKKTGEVINFPHWKNSSIFKYCLNYLEQKETNSCFDFLQYFKLYRTISKDIKNSSKSKSIQLFLKWLKLKKDSKNFSLPLQKEKSGFLLIYFNLLIKFLIKYSIFQKNQIGQNFKNPRIIKNENEWIENFIQNSNLKGLKKNFSVSSYQIIKLFEIYDRILLNSQKLAQIELNWQLIVIIIQSSHELIDIYKFKFLKQNIQQITQKITEKNYLIKFKQLKSTIYFSISLKEQLKYIFGKKKFIFRPERHKYLKTKTQFLLYNDDHRIKTKYHEKYDEKDLYTAVLIPEYGSWIRFGFQKNTKINIYKYPIKNQEDEIMIQLDKINQKPILYLLKEMGLTDLEIYNNLQHSDFFYFTNPLLINSVNLNQPVLRFELNTNYLTNISEFSKIFDPAYYRLGKIGRLKINNRLNLKLSQRFQTITYDDIFAIIDKLITLTISKTVQDDIDHLKNRRVRSIGELLQNLFRIGFQRLVRKLRNQTSKIDSVNLLSFNIVNVTVREFFGSSQLSQYLDQTNPLSSLTHRRRLSGLGPGGFNRDRISFAVRDIHPSHYGRICPIETPEGQNVGLIASLTTCARVNKSGFLETPFWRVLNGKVIKTGNPIYLTADIEDLYKIAPADIPTNNKNYLTKNVIPVRYQQDFMNVTPSEVEFISISPIQIVSVAASLIPFFEHDDANRALMGSNMQRQSVPLILPQKPIIGTGLENQIAIDSGMTINSQSSGIINLVTANKIIVKERTGKKLTYNLQKYLRSNQQTCINHRPIVWKGEKVKSGQILTDGPAITTSELALGQNVLVGYMPWQGYNFEDAILINERLVYEDIFTSIHIERYKIEIDRTSELSEQTTKNIPNLSFSEIQHLNDDGIVTVGTFVKPGDILVGKITSNDNSEQLPESKLLRAIFGAKAQSVKDNSFRMPDRNYGRVIETVTFNRRTRLTYKFEKIYIFIAQIRKIQVGDKIAGRHGNKGIISRILPRQDMPFLSDGTPIDIILNPLGVPSRMNVGQLYECLLGLAGDKLNCRFKILPFDEMYGLEMSRILINKKLRQASVTKNESWLFNPYTPGKMILIDGRTGKEFENPITVGNAYMLKLIHLVDDKMHARATGPYSLITQQPLRGKAQQGGQRFGEMEVWALEGFGAAFTLKELLTIKSDDMQGRNETLTAIVRGQQIPKFGIPESFKVLLQELRSIGLDMSTYKIEKFSSHKKYEVEVNLIERYNAFSKTFSPTSNINDISF